MPWSLGCCGESEAAAAALLMGRLLLGVFAKQRLGWNSLHLLQERAGTALPVSFNARDFTAS